MTIRQHYVPQVYLESWCNEKKQLDVHDKIAGKSLNPSPLNVLNERYYYEEPQSSPTNELERQFGAYEGAFGATLKFLNFVIDGAIQNGQPIAATLENMLENLPRHAVALKEFAGVAYFRTPGALRAMREQLAADGAPLAAKALDALNSPYALGKDAFESTLLERFRELSMIIGYTGGERLYTGDWPCYPLAGGEHHANFGYDIGNHVAAFAGMAVTPRLYILFLPNLQKRAPFVLGRMMPTDLVRQTNEMVSEVAMRWVVR
ncbi:DUF4238 domain-containing protein [Azorhizobium sp. AG788]|uniref:DUF4238 domain-containing protein n=1 Tax=Azorhizobium sp. AG788 TaxID=2183897 RepID=UPI00313A43DD